jgi:AcrR family transcriptional regulator
MKASECDPRSSRTRQRLRQALMQLVAEKRSTNLTIQAVMKAAGLNRTTFYLHYAGLHELLEDTARTLFEQMRGDIYGNRMDPIPISAIALRPFVESVFLHLEKHETYYRVMLGRQGDPLLRSLFQDLLSELIFTPIKMNLRGDELNPNLEMKLRFFSDGFIGVAAWWLERGRPISAAQASLQIARDILPDYLRLMNE